MTDDNKQRAAEITASVCRTVERLRTETPPDRAALQREIEHLRNQCAELYQVIGVLADRAGLFDDPQVTKALDNACAAASGLEAPYDDVLPFTVGRGKAL